MRLALKVKSFDGFPALPSGDEAPPLETLIEVLRALREDDWLTLSQGTTDDAPWFQVMCDAGEGYRIEYSDPEAGLTYASTPALASLLTAEAALSAFVNFGVTHDRFQAVTEWVKGEFQSDG